jgi:single-stranded-DNA-specific exonuclease
MSDDSDKTNWKLRAAEPAVIERLALALALPEPLARVMANRGVTDVDDAKRYLSPALKDLPDPARLAGIDEAVARLQFAIAHHEKIGIFGDYDVDGVTSSTLLWDFLEALGVDVVVTLPDRLQEGYGLSRAGVDRLADAGCRLVVTVDCGVTAHEEVEYACGRGIDVIVVDHHTVPVTLPRAVAVINPHRSDCASGAEHLCAVGVTFNLCLELRRRMRESGAFTKARPEPDLRRALDLVALGTVADVVPLIRDNRVFVTAGLKALAHGSRVGMRALLDVAQVQNGALDASTLGFQLGPRVNAAGRLGDAMQAVRLLRATDPIVARDLAVRLDGENASRRDLEKRITEEAIRQVTDSRELSQARAIVVGDDAWHPGVVGIVASRLVDRFGRPAIVVGEGGRGSGRSIPVFHLHDALLRTSAHLDGFGGHQHAAGVRVKAGALEQFRTAFIADAEQSLSESDLGRVISYDGDLALDDVSEALIHELRRAAPFGRANPEPVFRMRGVEPKALRELSGGHFKATLRERPKVEAIRFGDGARMSLFTGRIDLVGTPEFNVWRGATTLQVRVRDFAPIGGKP